MRKILSAAIVLMIVCLMGCLTAFAEEPCEHDWVAQVEPTCDSNGARGCSKCGATESISATGHNWSQQVAPTCDSNGARGCSKCGATESIPATGHSWSQQVAPSCDSNGARGCSKCGATESIPATGHNWSVNEATCTTNGARGCSKCGATESIPATGHNWSQQKAPTCTEAGARGCSKCGATESIDKLPHNVEIIPGYDATCREPGLSDGKYCSVCNTTFAYPDTIPTKKHQYRAKKVEATLTEGGYTRYTCSACGTYYIGKETQSFAATMGSIVFNAADEAMPYTVTEDGKVCFINAEPDADGNYTLRKLVLTANLIKGIADFDKSEITFVVGEYSLIIPVDVINQETVKALGKADEYVFTLEANAEGGCLVKAEILSAENAIDATNAIAGLKLCQGENEIEVTESKVYTVSAQ